jgi:hypothetical protein
LKTASPVSSSATSDKGYGLLNGRLYMPKSWFSKEQEKRRAFNLVPEDLVFETKQQIALKLIDEVRRTGCFPAKWIGADSAFGSDIEFLDALPKERFLLCRHQVRYTGFYKETKSGLPPYKGRGRRPTKPKILPGQPKPRSVAEIAKSDRVSWKPVVVAEGAKGADHRKSGPHSRLFVSRRIAGRRSTMALFSKEHRWRGGIESVPGGFFMKLMMRKTSSSCWQQNTAAAPINCRLSLKNGYEPGKPS